MTDHGALTRIWHDHLRVGPVYSLDALAEIASTARPERFGTIDRHVFRTTVAEQTDTGEAKVSLHSRQFREAGRDKRVYLGLPLNEVERQVALSNLTRRERDAIRGMLSGGATGPRKCKRLRGRDGTNVLRKLEAQHGQCGICGFLILPMHPGEAELDHILALSLGGPDVLGNTRAVHRTCNALLSNTGNEARVREHLRVTGWPVDADAAEIATARARGIE